MRSGIIASSYVRKSPRPMILRINTTNLSSGSTDDRTFRIPTIGTGYRYRVDWNGEAITRGHTGDAEYTFDTAGEKIIEIYGNFPRIYFNNGGDILKVLEVVQWGNTNLSTDQSRAFRGCANLVKIADDVSYFNNTTNGQYTFYDCSLTEIPEGLTLLLLTSGLAMFYNNSIAELPQNMLLPNLTNGGGMFINNLLSELPSEMTLDNLLNGGVAGLGSLGGGMFARNQLQSLPTGMKLNNLIIGGAGGGGADNGMFAFNPLSSVGSLELQNIQVARRMFMNTGITEIPSYITYSQLNDGTRFLQGVNLTPESYSNILINLDMYNNNILNLFGGDNKYNSSAVAARANLISKGWTITDGGLE